MSDKYIIRNCPAFVLMRTATSGTYFDMCGNAKGHIKCADCTDCVMKQIVEKCKTVIDDDVCLNCNKFERGLDCYECDYDGHREDIYMNRSYIALAKRILDLLDIQEVEDVQTNS